MSSYSKNCSNCGTLLQFNLVDEKLGDKLRSECPICGVKIIMFVEQDEHGQKRLHCFTEFSVDSLSYETQQKVKQALQRIEDIINENEEINDIADAFSSAGFSIQVDMSLSYSGENDSINTYGDGSPITSAKNTNAVSKVNSKGGIRRGVFTKDDLEDLKKLGIGTRKTK